MKIRPVSKRLEPKSRLRSLAARSKHEAIAFEIDPPRLVRLAPPFVRSAAPGVDPEFVRTLAYSDAYKAGAVHCRLYHAAIVMPETCGVFVSPDLADAESFYNPPEEEKAFAAQDGDEFATWNGEVAVRAEAEISGIAVLAGSKWCANYYHWHAECLPGVIELHSRIGHLRPTWLVPRLSAFQAASFEAIGISPRDVREIGDAYVRCERLALMSSNFEATWISPFVGRRLRAYRDRLREIVRGSAIEEEIAVTMAGERRQPENLSGRLPRRKRLYVSRRDSIIRPVQNEDDVIELLKRSYGFDVVVNASLSYFDQIAQYAEAEIIVGAHGAGLTNCVFAGDGAIVLELRPDNSLGRSPFWDRCYMHLAHALGLQYGFVCFSADPASESWRVDVEHLRGVLEALGW